MKWFTPWTFRSSPRTIITGIILLALLALIVYLFLPPKIKSFNLLLGNTQSTITLVKLSDSKFILQHVKGEEKNELLLNYTVFQADTSDVNSDGNTDVLIGGVMPSLNFILSERRLFVYELAKDDVVPLGSPIVFERFMVTFRTYCEKQRGIKAVEEDPKGGFMVAIYEWQGLRLKLNRYLIRGVSKEEALRELEG